MKNFYVFVLLLLGIVFPLLASAGNAEMLVSDEKEEKYVIDSCAVVKEGHTLVPLRPVMEALGANVRWHENTNTVTVQGEGLELNTPINSIYPTVNGKPIFTPAPVQLLNGAAFIPLPLVAQSFQKNVTWDSDARAIIISCQEKGSPGNNGHHNRVEINKACCEELLQIPGLEEEMAKNILAYRNAHGHFKSFEQLKNVPGMCETTLAKLKDNILITCYQNGLASFYASRFHGSRTASGERYNMHDYTAAHRTLPFGSYIKVTFLKTGKSIWVRINDRGPHVSKRIIDLSRGAADALGLTPYGLGEVKLTIITN